MAISKTSILNNALTRIGANPVTNIDDDTNNARILNRVYELSLRSILSECKWNFATKRANLSLTTDTVDWYYTSESETYVYQRPADAIRIFSTNDEDATWRLEGEYILSNTASLGIKYVYYLDEPNKYPASFIDAFVDKLCSEIAYMIVNSQSLGDKYKKLYESVSLERAMTENAQVGESLYLRDDAWELAKYNNNSVRA